MSFKNSQLLRRFNPPPSQTPDTTGQTAERAKLGKVVIAESNHSDLEHLAAILRGLNFTVLTAQDGKSALALARRHRPLLVLSSLSLPLLDGYKVAQQLRENRETNAIPFMFVVDSGDTPDRLIGHETVADDYIQKPFSVPEFESRVLRLVKSSRESKAPVPDSESAAPPDEIPETQAAGTPLKGEPATEPKLLVDPQVTGVVERMRMLLTELADCLGQFERNLRFTNALTEPFGTVAPPGRTPRRDEAGGRMLGFSSRPQPSAQLPEESPPPYDRGREGSPDLLDESTEEAIGARDRALVLLDQYRQEFRGMSEPPSEVPTPYEFLSQGADDQPPPSQPVTELDFDTDLLAKLGVSFSQSNTAEVKAEEFTSFARHSYLSAFREEIDRSTRTGSLYEEIQDFVLNSIRRAAVGGLPVVARAEALVRKLIDSLDAGDELLLNATDRTPNFSISAHSANVAILATRMAQVQERNLQFQLRVGLAGLLHEIGVVKLPERLIFKESTVSEAELGILRRRPLFSAGVLKNDFGIVSEIAGQIFERENGLGHPKGLQGREIRDEAKLIGVADFFEACIHKRPYRRPLTGYHTLYELSRDGEFQASAVRALALSVSLFPLHEILLLSTGEVARVIGVNRGNLSRPKVRVVLDAQGIESREPLVRDLAQNRSIRVVEVLSTEKLAIRRAGH